MFAETVCSDESRTTQKKKMNQEDLTMATHLGIPVSTKIKKVYKTYKINLLKALPKTIHHLSGEKKNHQTL